MEIPFLKRLESAWNAFRSRDPTTNYQTNLGPASSTRPDRPRLQTTTERSIVAGIYNRLSIDAASEKIQHVRVDDNDQYQETLNSGLNNCLTLEANIDQSGRAFIQDIVFSMLDEGVVSIVPVDTTSSPIGSFDILTMRTAKIVQWYPQNVRVNLYREDRGQREEITLPKTFVSVIENPFFATMNSRNSVMQRLIRKLNLLDAIDEQSGSGKLDLIIQLPYVVKTETKQKLAESRREKLEEQLSNSKYGIGYIDGTEKVIQLNRALENNLMHQIEYLTHMLYAQLGITESVFDGTANEETMKNYYNRSISPILMAVCEGMKRTFLTKTARTQGQSVMYFRDPFKFATSKDIAELADSLTRNEIVTSNEFRAGIGLKPSKAKNADELRNKNLNPAATTKENPPPNPS